MLEKFELLRDVIYENYPCPLLFDVITMSEQVVDLAW